MRSCHSTHHFISFVTMADPPDASAVTAQGASGQMAADALKMVAADEQNEVSEVESGLSESEGSGVSATTRLARSSYPASRKVKKKASKKKDTSKRKDGVKDCWACMSSSANLDELQEYWRRKLNSEKLGTKSGGAREDPSTLGQSSEGQRRPKWRAVLLLPTDHQGPCQIFRDEVQRAQAKAGEAKG